MAKTKVPKNLEVDGTPKLAARTKGSDKHDKSDLNIEEATVASPRRTRNRAGDFHDFEGEDSAEEEPSNNSTARKSKGKVDVAVSDKAKKSKKKKSSKHDIEDDDEDIVEEEPSSKSAASKKQKKAKKTVAGNDGESKRKTDDLIVDGTARLAVRANPTDKHENPNLNIEEATVAAIEVEKLGKGKPKPANKAKKGTTAAGGVDEPKSKTDDLKVDGTSKLAAKAKPTDKHEIPNLNVEEATVAAVQVEKLGMDKSKPAAKGKRGKAAKEDGSEPIETTTGKDASKKKTTKEPKTAKVDAPSKEKAQSSKKSRKSDEKETAEEDKSAEASATKSKKSKAGSKKEAEKSAAIGSDVAMDEGPFETLLESANGKASEDAAAESAKHQKGGKAMETLGKEPKAPKVKPSKAPVSETADKAVETLSKKTKAGAKAAKKTAEDNVRLSDAAPEAADTAKKQAKSGAEKAKRAVKAKAPSAEGVAEAADTVQDQAKATLERGEKAVKNSAPSTETAAELAETLKKQAKAGVEKGKKATKDSVPSTSTAAEVAETLNKQTKAGFEKGKKIVEANAPTTEKPAEVAKVVTKNVKAAAEKAAKAVKPKQDSKSTGKQTSTDESSKPETSKSKKRKAPVVDAEDVRANLLDPLSEHAETSAKKKQKQDKAKSKSLGDAVGDLISSAAEGATAARASLGGFANTLIGGATETMEGVVDGAADATEAVESAAKVAKGKGKAVAEDVAEALGKATGLKASSDAEQDDSSEYESDEDSEPDDHTAALLAGFESGGDATPTSGSGFQKGQNLPEMPNEKATKKKLKGVKAGADEGPGVVYVGRIPHGFYEHEMREYFSQFGDINRLRLSRNKKSGASRHWAFIEFKSAGVAKIVVDTMDNYLMFGHILKCKTVPQEQLHENVWKGADKRFKKVPWGKLEGRKHEVPVGRMQWTARNENEEKRRASKKEKTKEIGYEFEAPPLKGVDQVPVKDTTKEIESKESFEEERSLVTAAGEGAAEPVVVSEEVKTKKSKKSAKGGASETTTTVMKKTKKRPLDTEEGAAGSKTKKAKGAAA